MASKSKNGHESSRSNDSTSPVAASTASWLFHRMISTEFSKGEDEWEMQLRKSRRKKRRESKSELSSKDNDDRPGEEDAETCSDMDTSSDEFFSATEELLSSTEDEEVDGLSDLVSSQCRVSVPLPEASERGRNRRQKKKRRRQLQEQLTATLQTLPLFDDSLGKVTVPKEDPSFKLSIDISEDAVLAAQGVTPSATLCVEVPTLVELCLRKIWKNTPKSGVLPSKRQKVPYCQELPYQVRVQAGLITLERERRQFSLQWLLTALRETEGKQFENRPAAWWAIFCSLPEYDFITSIAQREERRGQKKNKGELLLSIEPGWVHFLFTTADCGWEMETPSFLPNEQTETEAMLNSGGTVMKCYNATGGWFISGLARLIGLFLPDNLPASHLTRMDGSLAPLVYRVKSQLCQRFPAMCRVGFDVALAYVWWSRGFVDATVSSLLKLSKNALDGAMKSFYLNEIGRLYWHLRDCTTAGRFFRLAAESIPVGPRHSIHAEGTALVLIASMCDSGLLGPSSGRQAHRAWSVALSCLHSYHDRQDRVAMPSPVFVNAVESMVFCHAGKSFQIDPASRNRESVDSWLASVVEWLRPLGFRHPWLSYHLSVLLSLLTMQEQSEIAFVDFAAYTHFEGWAAKNQPISESPPSFLGSCWSQLEEIVKSACRSHGYLPLLQIRWRTMLGYPCLSGDQAQRFRLAEQHGLPLNIRLHDTSHITANVMMELPYYQPVYNMLDGSITHQLSAESVDPWIVDALPYARATRTSHNCFLLLDDSKGHRVVCHRYTRPVGCEVVVLELSGVDGCRKQPVRLKLERAVREARYKEVRELIDERMVGDRAEKARKCLKEAISQARFPPSNVDLMRRQPSHHSSICSGFEIVGITIFGKATICFNLGGLANGVDGSYLAVVDARSVDGFLSPRIYLSFPEFLYMEYAFCSPLSEKNNVTYVDIVRFPSTSHLFMRMKCDVPNKRGSSRFAVLTENGQLSYHPYPSCDCIFENSEFEYSAQYDHYAVVVEKRQPHRDITWLARKFDLTNMKPLNVCELAVEGGVGVTCHPLRPVAGVLFISCPSGVFAVDMVSMKTPDEVADKAAAVALLIADQRHESQDAGTGTDASAVDGSQHGVATSGAAGVDHVTEDDGADEVSISDITFDDMATYPVLTAFFPGRFQLTKVIGHSPETMVMHEGVAIGKSCDLVLATDYHIRWLRLYKGLRGTTAICQLFTTQLASWPVEACFLPAGKGLLVTSTIFLKSRTDGGFCREQLYWFSEQGELLGFLPFLGAGPHDFYPVLREKVHGSDDANDGQHVEGLFVYFSDGHGAMACIQLE